MKPVKLKGKRAAFLAAFAKLGNVTAAAKASKVDRTSHYGWMEDAAYAQAFKVAIEEAADNLETEARRRAEKGVLEPIWHKGEKVGSVRKYSDTLLIFLLKGAQPEKYRERIDQHQVNETRTVIEFGLPAPPIDPPGAPGVPGGPEGGHGSEQSSKGA